MAAHRQHRPPISAADAPDKSDTDWITQWYKEELAFQQDAKGNWPKFKDGDREAILNYIRSVDPGLLPDKPVFTGNMSTPSAPPVRGRARAHMRVL